MTINERLNNFSPTSSILSCVHLFQKSSELWDSPHICNRFTENILLHIPVKGISEHRGIF